MIRFHALGVSFSLPLVTLLTPLVYARITPSLKPFPLFLALSVHELSHILAARFLRVQIHEIRLMPFGGSARMENPYGLSSVQLCFTALAGPISNLCAAVCFAALAHWNIISARLAAIHAQMNLMLFFFNLLPALPLDGGRILYCVLKAFFRPSTSMKIGIMTGKLVAAVFLLTSLVILIRFRKLNPALILAGITILISARDEEDALFKAEAMRFVPRDQTAIRSQFYQMSSESTAIEAVRLMRPTQASWFLISKNRKPVGLLDGQAILEYLRNGGSSDTALDRLPYLKFLFEG